MKFKHLTWESQDGDHTTTMYDSQIGWVCVLAFFKGGLWRLNTENKDPSEQIATGSSLSEIKEKAQKLHNSSVKADFF